MVKLTDVADIKYGCAFDSKSFTDDDSYPQLVRIRDVKRGFSETFYKGEYSRDYVLSEGDLLVGMDGEFNIARWKVDGALLNQRVCKIVARPGTYEEYLRFILGKVLKEIEGMTSFATVKHLSAKELNKLELDMPKYEEQVHRSRVLLKVENIIDKRQLQLDNLDELVRARFVEMFGDLDENPHGWNKSLLSNVILNANNGMSRRGNDKYGNIVMRLIELQEGFIDYSRPNRIMLKDYEKKRYLLKEKDVLFARVNGNPNNVGRCAVFYDIDEDVYHNDHIIRVHFDEKILDAIFASTVLNSDYGKRQLMGKIKTSAGQYTVSQDGIGSILIALPPIEIQQEFASFVEQVNKSKVEVQKALDKAQVLFDSLMQKYFG